MDTSTGARAALEASLLSTLPELKELKMTPLHSKKSISMKRETVIRTVSHAAHSQQFVIYLCAEPESYAAYAYIIEGEKEAPVSPSYSASYEVHYNYFQQHGEHIGDHLIAISISDIDERMYLKVKSDAEHEALNRISENRLSRPQSRTV